MLKPQDLLLLLKLAVSPDAGQTLATLGESLGLSIGETHRALQRAGRSRLCDVDTRTPRRTQLLEFLLHGAPYVYPAHRGARTRGVPTSVAAAPLDAEFSPHGSSDATPVWPDADGPDVGYGLPPIYPSAPVAARSDARLYEVLALFDALRDGRARERNRAAELLTDRIAP